MVKNDREKALYAIESLLKDIEQVLAQSDELSEEFRAAIERLRQMCIKEKTLSGREED